MSSSRVIKGLTVPEFLDQDSAPPPCSQVDPELFFAQEVELSNGTISAKYINLSAAKAICDSCPLKIECLEYALTRGEIGIWGGTTEEQRNSLRRRYGIAKKKRDRTPTTW